MFERTIDNGKVDYSEHAGEQTVRSEEFETEGSGLQGRGSRWHNLIGPSRQLYTTIAAEG